ncbi:MAG: hypothetical protein J7L38_00445 [Thermoproteales archaeon]|nr:hypothetical protein [Thermoproteales archaeon]RLE67202.1 MAG: hypothetical protein DRJ47_00680 [Thermoprotei archaeon]
MEKTRKGRKREYVNIPIPRPLYERLAKALEDSGYRSPTEYIIFLIRKNLPDLESKEVERRLRALGYLP